MKLEELLTRPEGKTLEFKQDLSSPKNILKTLTAFANMAGGVLLIGIEDGSRAVLGLAQPLDEEERLCNLIADSIEPRLAPDVELLNWKGRTLLAVQVYPSPLRPHWLKSLGMENGVLVRVGSTNRRADGPLTAELRRSVLNLSYDEEPMPDINPEVLDFRVASGLFAGLREWNEQTPENLRLVTRHQGRLAPTVGGVLLFGAERERYFPDAWIQCGRFRGTDKSRILDQRDIRTHLPLALNDAFEFVKKHALRSAEFGELRRKDIWNVPLEAIREALINAIVHSEGLGDEGRQVSRIEWCHAVESPGYAPASTSITWQPWRRSALIVRRMKGQAVSRESKGVLRDAAPDNDRTAAPSPERKHPDGLHNDRTTATPPASPAHQGRRLIRCPWGDSSANSDINSDIFYSIPTFVAI